MATSPVSSGSSSPVTRSQPQVDQARQAEQQARKAEQAKQAEQVKPTEEPKAKPIVNTQGQTTGNTINTTS